MLCEHGKRCKTLHWQQKRRHQEMILHAFWLRSRHIFLPQLQSLNRVLISIYTAMCNIWGCSDWKVLLLKCFVAARLGTCDTCHTFWKVLEVDVRNFLQLFQPRCLVSSFIVLWIITSGVWLTTTALPATLRSTW